MDLSPEERKRIYEEEKARIEGEQKLVGDFDKQKSDRLDDYFKYTRGGRITSSSFAIACCLVLLIFFNFFSQYIAYYHLEKTGNVAIWVREPILTSAFSSWLLILSITLSFSIIGHIILIVFDKYILREATLIVLNLFGIATVITLLSIFPFDFSVIPNVAWADSMPIISRVVLALVLLVLGIATLVRLIRLIVNLATGAARY